MKQTTTILLILALTTAYTYQACCTACISKLTTDTEMTDSDEGALPTVETYTTPVTDSEQIDADGFCGAVFAEHGTCCNQAQLEARADAWAARLEKRSERVTNGLDKLDDVVDSIDKIKTYVSEEKDDMTSSEANTENTGTGPMGNYTPPAQNSTGNSTLPVGPTGKGKPKQDLQKPDSSRVSEIETDMDFIQNQNSTERETTKTKAKENRGNCQSTLAKLRKSALCLRCSGVASDYYDSTTQSYKLSEADCTEVITACAEVFAALAEANKMFTNLAVIKKAKGGEVDEGAQDVVMENEDVTKWKECANDVDACVNDQTNVNELCSEFTLSSDNQEVEGNVESTAEGIAVGEAIKEDKPPKDAAGKPSDLDARRLLTMRLQKSLGFRTSNSRVLETTTDEDDGYGYASASTSGASLTSDFSSTGTTTTVTSTSSKVIINFIVVASLISLIF